MKYKVGDKVKIKSLEWYNANKDKDGKVFCGKYDFIDEMIMYCGDILTIETAHSDSYDFTEDLYRFIWTDEMIECLVERNGKTYPYKIGDRVILKGNNRCATITDLKYNCWGNLTYYIKIDNDKDISIDYPTNLLLPCDNINNMVEDVANEPQEKMVSLDKVCKYWENIAKNPSLDKDLFKARVKELKNTVKDKTQIPQMIEDIKNQMLDNSTPNGYLMGVDMSDYISDMVIAQAYAKFNHHIIIKRIEDIFRKINGGVVIDTIQSIHNYIDMNDHIIRKGAIRSYVNERMLVPFNMRDGIAICVGKSNPEWNCSCSYGAGRKLSRSQAKKTISMEDYKESMNGVYSTSINYSTLDESPMAYKDTDTIMHLISDTCEIIEVVKPIINIKAGESDN